MRRHWLASLILLLSIAPSVAGAASPAGRHPSPARKRPARKPVQPAQVAVIETVLGTIVIKLYEKEAPKAVANFKRLVQRGFFDSTYFHLAIPGFLIQGGDPNTRNDVLADDGRGGPGYTLPAENRLPHLRGSVSTVAENDSLANGSQFIITASPQPSLDAAGFAIFGEVISPLEVVDRIEALGDDPNCPHSNSGPNPAWHALILRATLEPLVQWQNVPADGATSP